METNELIAEFMELETTLTHKGVKEYYQREYNSGSWYEEHQLRYHNSWDWLMPVVIECFERFGNTDTIDYMRLNDALLTCNIDELYQVVVEFIKEYNKQN